MLHWGCTAPAGTLSAGEWCSSPLLALCFWPGLPLSPLQSGPVGLSASQRHGSPDPLWGSGFSFTLDAKIGVPCASPACEVTFPRQLCPWLPASMPAVCFLTKECLKVTSALGLLRGSLDQSLKDTLQSFSSKKRFAYWSEYVRLLAQHVAETEGSSCASMPEYQMLFSAWRMLLIISTSHVRAASEINTWAVGTNLTMGSSI